MNSASRHDNGPRRHRRPRLMITTCRECGCSDGRHLSACEFAPDTSVAEARAEHTPILSWPTGVTREAAEILAAAKLLSPEDQRYVVCGLFDSRAGI